MCSISRYSYVGKNTHNGISIFWTEFEWSKKIDGRYWVNRVSRKISFWGLKCNFLVVLLIYNLVLQCLFKVNRIWFSVNDHSLPVRISLIVLVHQELVTRHLSGDDSFLKWSVDVSWLVSHHIGRNLAGISGHMSDNPYVKERREPTFLANPRYRGQKSGCRRGL